MTYISDFQTFTSYLRIGLPIYFLLYFGIAFIAKSWIVAQKIGKNPFVIPNDDSAYGLVGFYFKLTMIALFIYVILYALLPSSYPIFLPIKELEIITIQFLGIGLLLIALIWIIIAQSHMRDSWRIGIDTETQTKLVTAGLFGISRNPIFFGMILSLAGLFLVTPNAFTVLLMILGYVLIQIQIRLEEAYLTEQHGSTYLNYKEKVRRLL